MEDEDSSNNEIFDEKSKTKRKLASVQVISDIIPHTNPKAVEKWEIAKVLGWEVVIAKGQFQKDEKIIYFEIDSLLPNDKSWAAPMKGNKFRVKSKKLAGALSQGFIAKLSILQDYDQEFNEAKYEIGHNLTDLLNIVKYDNNADCNYKKVKPLDPFPDKLMSRSDEPRIQSNQHYLEIFKDKPYYITLKYDGMSGTFLFVDDEFYICSRNTRVNCGPYLQIAKKYKIEEKLKSFNKQYAIQGECYGPNIIKNFLGVKEVEFVVFTIKDLKNNRYLDMQELIDLCEKMELPMVKILEKGDKFNYTEEQLKEMAKGNYEGTEYPREGIVLRLQKDWYPDEDNRYSFKYVNDDFLTYNATHK